MIEFEIRFKLERDLSEDLKKLGFKKITQQKIIDLVFEPKDWIRGTGLRQGYFIKRLRLSDGQKPKLQIKEFLRANEWREETQLVSNLHEEFQNLCKEMVPSKIISKQRETWNGFGIDVCIDEVENLGKFVEFEGPQWKVETLAKGLGFDPENPEKDYGHQIFLLERNGKVKFSLDQMRAAIETFK